MKSEPALLPGIILSDSVIREQGSGKCSFIGSFQSYTLPQFPFAVPPFFVTSFVTNLTDATELNLTARIEDPSNGMVIASSACGVVLGRPSKRNEVYEIPIPMPGLTFMGPANYRVVVLVNNEKIGERDLFVIPATLPPQHQ